MKTIYFIILFMASVFSTTAFAQVTVTDVENMIAKGDYTQAKAQLEKVLSEHPDSYVATRYMLEIIKIENARDNVSSVEYKIYEDRLASIEKAKAYRLAAIAEAERKARNERWLNGFITFLKYLFFLIVILGVGVLLVIHHRKRMLKRSEFDRAEKWKADTIATLLDINVAIESLLEDERNQYKIKLQKDLALIGQDNEDALNQIQLNDYNEELVDRHISNAVNYLRKAGATGF